MNRGYPQKHHSRHYNDESDEDDYDLRHRLEEKRHKTRSQIQVVKQSGAEDRSNIIKYHSKSSRIVVKSDSHDEFKSKNDTPKELHAKKMRIEAEVHEIVSDEDDHDVILADEKPPQKEASEDESSKTSSDSESKLNTTNENDDSRGTEEVQPVKDKTPDVQAEEILVQEEISQVEPPKIQYNCAIQGCRSVEEYECLNKIEEGTYGVVYRAKDKKTGELVALKRLKMEKEREGFPITSLREIDTLLKAQHPNVVTVKEIVVGSNMDKIYLVMDFVEHDLKSLMQHSMKKPFMIGEVKALMQQLLKGIAHLHDNWIIHRDLKTSNLLLSHKGVLKIGDFGLAREYGSPLKSYTPIVVTLWYRSVELLLGVQKYSTAVDMWSIGTIFGELLLMKALFQGKNEKDQLDKIFKDLGTPNEKIWPDYKEMPLVKKLTFPEFPYNTLRSRFGPYLTDSGFDLLMRLLTYDPARRISAEDALKHKYFDESPLPTDISLFPTWPAKSEGNSKKLPDNEPKAPEAGRAYASLYENEVGFSLQMPVATGVSNWKL